MKDGVIGVASTGTYPYILEIQLLLLCHAGITAFTNMTYFVVSSMLFWYGNSVKAIRRERDPPEAILVFPDNLQSHATRWSADFRVPASLELVN